MEKEYRYVPRQDNLAYDFRRAERPEERPEREERILREPKIEPRTRKQHRISLSYLLCAFAAALLLAVTVSSYARLTELNVKASALEKELSALQLEHSGILASQDKKINAAELAEYAETKLGMVQSGVANVEYIVLGTEDEIVVAGGSKTTAAETMDSILAFADHIIEYFR